MQYTNTDMPGEMTNECLSTRSVSESVSESGSKSGSESGSESVSESVISRMHTFLSSNKGRILTILF